MTPEREAEIRKKYIELAHYGNGTGCRCCDLVDDGILECLLAELDRLRAELAEAQQTLAGAGALQTTISRLRFDLAELRDKWYGTVNLETLLARQRAERAESDLAAAVTSFNEYAETVRKPLTQKMWQVYMGDMHTNEVRGFRDEPRDWDNREALAALNAMERQHEGAQRLIERLRFDLAAAQEALKEIVQREARSEYSSIYAAPGEFAQVARDALRAAAGGGETV